MESNNLTKRLTVLYVYSGEFSRKYFESENECNEYYEEHYGPFSDICVIEYLGCFAGKDDVIKVKRQNEEKYFSVCDEVSYYRYQPHQDNDDVFHWEKIDGIVEWMYNAFRDNGIIFKNDIYAKAKEEQQQLVKILKQASKNIFN